MDAYRAALYSGHAPEAVSKDQKSLSGLIETYLTSQEWARLQPATQRQRKNILDRIEKVAGNNPASEIDAAMVKSTRDKLGPGAAKHFVQTMRGMFQWAVENGRAECDPTEGVKVARPKTDGFETWTDADIAAYEARWPIGTRQRLWLAVLLYTGLRRGDACALGPQHIKDGIIELRTAKTGVPIVIPMAHELAEIIAASRIGSETLISTVHGTPMTKEFFGNLFRESCNAAGVEKSAHGLRKAATVRLAEAGATVAELNAVMGWTGAKMALLYVEKADRARLAKQAFERLKQLR